MHARDLLISAVVLISLIGAACASGPAHFSFGILGGISSFLAGIVRAIVGVFSAPTAVPTITAAPLTTAPPATTSFTTTALPATTTILPQQECDLQTMVYVGGILNCTPYSVTLTGVYTQPPVTDNTFRYQASFTVYYNGALVNSSLLYSGSTKMENVSGSVIYVHIGEVADGGTYVGKYALINVSTDSTT